MQVSEGVCGGEWGEGGYPHWSHGILVDFGLCTYFIQKFINVSVAERKTIVYVVFCGFMFVWRFL